MTKLEPGWLAETLAHADRQTKGEIAVQVAASSKKPAVQEALRTFINAVHDHEPESYVETETFWRGQFVGWGREPSNG